MKSYHLYLKEQHFELLPHKSVFWHEKKTLILSDLHLGKTGHFRKHGLSLPPESGMKDLVALKKLLHDFQPSRLLILGDLFHSEYNQDWDHFGTLRQEFPAVRFDLVPGNHDILPTSYYTQFGISFLSSKVEEGQFVFSHVPFVAEQGLITISGHIHPGFYMEGRAKHAVRLPCFYFLDDVLLLPAFGKLTGLKMMPKTPKAEIFVVAGASVHKIGKAP